MRRLLHLRQCHQASHRKNPLEKVKFIKRIDEELIKTILEEVKEEVNILITSDHSTLSSTGNHRGDLQPFILFNNRINRHKQLGIIDGKEAIRLMKYF